MEIHRKVHVELDQLQKQYSGQRVLEQIHLNVRQGEFIAIVGKSGCGKSTLLRLLSGLEKPDGGEIRMDGKPLAGLNRQACMMFQDGRLLPWKKVVDNVSLGLKGNPKTEALEVLKSVGLDSKAYEWPTRLSGGQKQRVALARALMHKPDLLLLDEPLGALDALTRLEMQNLIEQLWIQRGFTALLVTHDVEEAVALADRVILLKEGVVAQEILVPLPRPRQRETVRFTSLVNGILQNIIRENENSITSAASRLNQEFLLNPIAEVN